MRIIKRIYSLWCYFWFVGLFLLLFPFFFVFLQRETWKPQAHFLNRLWAKLYFPLCGIPVEIDYRFHLDGREKFVFCANHTSYLDIAVMGLVVPNFYAFVGKSSLGKIPLFGYMFTKLHIQVDRSNKRSSHRTFQRALAALDQGRSIMIFPEGGIVSKNPPALAPFKDGPFRMAIEKQVPIVPITFPYNWIVLPDDKRLLFTRRRIKVTVLPPIPTTGLTLDDLDELKAQTFRVMENALAQYLPADNRLQYEPGVTNNS